MPGVEKKGGERHFQQTGSGSQKTNGHKLGRSGIDNKAHQSGGVPGVTEVLKKNPEGYPKGEITKQDRGGNTK